MKIALKRMNIVSKLMCFVLNSIEFEYCASKQDLPAWRHEQSRGAQREYKHSCEFRLKWPLFSTENSTEKAAVSIQYSQYLIEIPVPASSLTETPHHYSYRIHHF